jgi:hypothetical protein
MYNAALVVGGLRVRFFFGSLITAEPPCAEGRRIISHCRLNAQAGSKGPPLLAVQEGARDGTFVEAVGRHKTHETLSFL